MPDRNETDADVRSRVTVTPMVGVELAQVTPVLGIAVGAGGPCSALAGQVRLASRLGGDLQQGLAQRMDQRVEAFANLLGRRRDDGTVDVADVPGRGEDNQVVHGPAERGGVASVQRRFQQREKPGQVVPLLPRETPTGRHAECQQGLAPKLGWYWRHNSATVPHGLT